MKKYVLLGFTVGVFMSLVLWYIKRRAKEGDEFEELYNSVSTPKELFGAAFKTIPDKP